MGKQRIRRILCLENMVGEIHLQESKNIAFSLFPDPEKVYFKLLEKLDHCFKTVKDPKSSTVKATLDLLLDHFKALFNQYGCPFPADPQDINLPSPDNINKNMQVMLYFQALLILKGNMNEQGKLQIKSCDSRYKEMALQILDHLMAAGFYPAYHLKADQELDARIAQQIYLQGAKLGDPFCKAKVAQDYLSYLMGNLLNEQDYNYPFPEGMDENGILAWLKESQMQGNMLAISYAANFLSNFFGAAPSLYQEGVSKQQKQKLNQLANIVPAIAQDPDHTVSKFVAQILTLPKQEDTQTDKVKKAKKLGEAANWYVTHKYSAQFFPQQHTLQAMTAKKSSLHMLYSATKQLNKTATAVLGYSHKDKGNQKKPSQ